MKHEKNMQNISVAVQILSLIAIIVCVGLIQPIHQSFHRSQCPRASHWTVRKATARRKWLP